MRSLRTVSCDMKAKYVQRGDSIDFTPSVDMEAGEIVRLGNLIGITKIPIAAGTLGSVSVTGVFDVVKPSGITFAVGESVFWANGTASKTGSFLGMAIAHAGGAADSVRILLNCNANEETSSSGTDAEWLPL